MKKSEYLYKLAEVLGEEPENLTPETILGDLPGWDSMGQIAVLAFSDDELGVLLPSGALAECKTVTDLMALVQGKLEE